MSRIDDLIAELCSDGVEFKELGVVARYSDTRVVAATVDEMTFIGVDNLLPNQAGRTYSTYVPTTGNLTGYQQGDILIGNIRPYLKKIWLAANFGGCSGDVLAVRIIEAYQSTLMPEFLYRILSSETFFAFNMQHAKGAKMPRGSKAMIMKYRIPVPPLEIQREIVKVLDTFTRLEAELEAELEARRRQYQYYRDALLSFGEDLNGSGSRQQAAGSRQQAAGSRQQAAGSRQKIRQMTLSELFNMRAGQHISANKIVNEQGKRYEFPCFGGNGIRGFVENYSHDGHHLIIGRQGALCGNVQRARGKFYATEHAVVVIANDEVNIDWAFHMLTLMNLNQYASKSAQPGLAVGKLEAVRIGVPPLEEQARIVAILDRFDALVNDISIGLPAEIKARRQQYEHYRDRLLSFNEFPSFGGVAGEA